MSLCLIHRETPPWGVLLRSTACILPAANYAAPSSGFYSRFACKINAPNGCKFSRVYHRLRLFPVCPPGIQYAPRLKYRAAVLYFLVAFGSIAAAVAAPAFMLSLLPGLSSPIICSISRRVEHKQPARASTVAPLCAQVFNRCILGRLYRTKNPRLTPCQTGRADFLKFHGRIIAFFRACVYSVYNVYSLYIVYCLKAPAGFLIFACLRVCFITRAMRKGVYFAFYLFAVCF